MNSLYAAVRGFAARRVVRDLGITFGGKGLQMVLALLGSILSARALGPVDLGRFGLVISIVTISGTLADAGLTYTTIKFIAQHADGDLLLARRYSLTYFGLRVLSGTLVGAVGFLCSGLLASWLLGRPDLTPYLQLAFAILISLGISSYPGTVLTGLSHFGRLGLSGVLNAMITLSGIGVLFLVGRLDLPSLIAWNVILPVLSTLPSWWFLPDAWLPWHIRREVGTAHSREIARQLLGFSKWLAISAVGSIIAAQLDVILLGRLQGPAVVGVYTVALALAMRLDTLNQSLLTVLLPRASKLAGHVERREYTRQVGRGSLLLAAGLGVVALVSQPLIVLFYGARYLPSAGLFLALLPVVLFDLVTSSLFLLALPLNRPRVLAISDWLRVGSMGLAGWLLIPGLAGYGAAIARFFSRVVGAGYTFAALRGSRPTSEDPEPSTAASRWAS